MCVCGSGTPKIGIGALVGAGIVVTMGVAGAVALTSAARINRRPFMRDAGFYVIAVLYLLWMLLDGHVHILEALGTVNLHGIMCVCGLSPHSTSWGQAFWQSTLHFAQSSLWGVSCTSARSVEMWRAVRLPRYE